MDVLDELGEPEGKMNMGGALCLSYTGGVVKIKNGKVVYITPDFQKRAMEEKKIADYVAAQKAKGLVNYRGEWMTPEEKEKRSAQRKAALKKLQQERAALPAIKIIKQEGRSIDLKQVIIPGKVTIVDFYADWCKPCLRMSPYLEKLAHEDQEVFLRKIDIVNWHTPVVKQYNIRGVPNVRVYDRQGKMVGAPTHSFKEVIKNVEIAKGN